MYNAVNNFNYGQVALNSVTATLVVPQNNLRQKCTLRTLASIVIYVGDANVTALTGQQLVSPTGQLPDELEIVTGAAVYAISASATPSVSFMDQF